MIFNFNKHPRKKIVYAITGGKYLGELLVFMEERDKNFFFLSLPEMHVREVPKEKFSFGLEEKIIEIVKKIPSYVYSVCKAQYLKNKTREIAVTTDK
jgi:hypothetical protein